MGVKKEAAKQEKKQAKADAKVNAPVRGIADFCQDQVFRCLPLIAVLAATYCAGAAAEAEGSWLRSDVEKKMHIFFRFLFFLFVQAFATDFFAHEMLQVARFINGDGALAIAGAATTSNEMAVNDPSIPWPQVELLSEELRPYTKKPSAREFSLNHVRGKRRFKDALTRLGMNIGSTLCVWALGHWLDNGRTLASVGMTMDSPFYYDVLVGVAVGVTIVAVMFIVELYAGWLHFLKFFEVFDASENFGLCILWDVIFHLNVALNEELPVRGWMLYNLAEAFAANWQLGPVAATLYAMIFQSGFFVMLHLASPGGMRLQSMTNIFVGGMAGGLGVLFTGGRLGFSLGWHFGWNISMGNVFGLSTSGIPISATFVAVAPLPGKAHLHGGVFGPEGGMMAPVSYLLGVVLLGLIYGIPDAAAAGSFLVAPEATSAALGSS